MNPKITAEFLNKNFNNNMTELLGIVYTEIGDDFIKGEMEVTEKVMQPLGFLHGGASVVFAESLGSVASNSYVDQSKYACFGLEVNANHVRSVQSGTVYGHAMLVHKGTKTHIWEIKITDKDDRLVCTSRLTVAVSEKR